MRIDEITKTQSVDLSGLRSLFVGKQSQDEIVSIVASHIEEMVDEEVDVDTVTRDGVPEGMVMVGGAYYDPENDQDGDVPVEVIIAFHPSDDVIVWDDDKVDYFVNELEDAIKHELLHASQYRKRDFHPGAKPLDRRSKEYEYLSKPDELEAYAMNIADELVRIDGKDMALKMLRIANKTAHFPQDPTKRKLSPNLHAFMSAYEGDATNPVLKRLLKKIYQYITNV